jgi:hypothetical protein
LKRVGTQASGNGTILRSGGTLIPASRRFEACVFDWDGTAVPADEVRADLIALAWAQDLRGTRATVVREALARGRLPVLLVPRAGP